MRILLCFAAILFFFDLFGKEQVTSSDVQNGEVLMTFSCEPDKSSGATIISCDLYGPDLTVKGNTKIPIVGYAAKRCFATPHYNRVQSNTLDFIELVLSEKVFSKQFMVVCLSPELEVLCSYHQDVSDVSLGTEHALEFFERGMMPCFPMDNGGLVALSGNGITGDCWAEPGGLAYLYYDEECTESYGHGRVLFTRKPAKKDSKLFYFKANNDVIKRSWSLNIEEERILHYQIYAYDTKLFIYTNYLAGDSGGKGNEKYESRIRLVDRLTGVLVYNCLLPVKGEHELMLSDVTYNGRTGELFWAGNYVSITETPWNENNDETNSFFVVGKIGQKGEVSAVEKDVTWTATKNAVKKKSFPMIAVRSMGITSEGNLMVAGLNLNWTADCADNSRSLGLGSMGLQVMYFSPELKEISSEQFAIPLVGIYEPVIYESYTCDIRQSLISSYYSDLYKYNKTTWDPENETLVMVQLNWSFEPVTKNRNYYVLKMVKGKKDKFSEIGEINMSAPGMVLPNIGFILNANMFCGLKSENPRNLAVLKF